MALTMEGKDDSEYINLSEITAPAPVQNTGYERTQHKEDCRTSPADYPNGDNHSSGTNLTDNYEFPDAIENVDEVGAPSPVNYDQVGRSLQQSDYHLSRDVVASRDAGIVAGESTMPETLGRDESSGGSDRASKRMTLLYTVSHLIFFSFAGTLCRLIIEGLTFYPGAPATTSVLWANFAGSLAMGFLSEDKKLFRSDDHAIKSPGTLDDTEWKAQHMKHKKSIPLYIGLTAGFCGCLTSFSTFLRDVFLAIANDLSAPINQATQASLYTAPATNYQAPNGGYSFMAVVAILILEIGLSLVALFLGAHIAIFAENWMPVIYPWCIRRVVDPLMLVLAPLTWVAIICLAVRLPDPLSSIALWSEQTWRGPVLYSCVFSPLGCLLRFYLSLSFNGRIPSFPLGTFLANVGGTMILGMAFSVQHAPISPATPDLGGGSFTGCHVLQGVMDGFCGCLTTVSTWVLELSGTKRRHAYIYGSISIAVALIALVIEMGSLKWSRGFITPVCFT